MDAPRPQRNRIHIDVDRARGRGRRPHRRRRWRRAARWCPTRKPGPSGCSPIPRATRPACAPGRTGLSSGSCGSGPHGRSLVLRSARVDVPRAPVCKTRRNAARAHLQPQGQRDHPQLVRRRRRGPRPRPARHRGRPHPAGQAQADLRPPPRHRRPRDRRQRREGRAHRQQGRAEDRLPPLRATPAASRPAAYADAQAAKPEEAVRRAVRGMLPKNRLGRQMLPSSRSTPARTTRTRPRSPSRSRSPPPGVPRRRSRAPAPRPDDRPPQGGRRPRARPSQRGEGDGTITVNRRPLADYFPSETHRMILTEPLRATERDRGLRRRRHDRRRRPHRPGRRPAPRHRPGAGRARPRAAAHAQAGRLPHARRPREGVQEVRPQEGPQGAAVLQAVSAAARRSACSARAGFGTDGVRGVANVELTPELVLALGRAAARVLGADRFVVGRDTRRSGPLLEAALVAGLAAEGVDVALLGVAPTPAVAWLAAAEALPGAVISASHNPFADNGIKLFAPAARKLTDEVEAALEAELDRLLDGRAAGSSCGGAADRRGRSTAHADVERLGAVGGRLARRARPRRAARRHRLRQRRGLRWSRPRCSGDLGADGHGAPRRARTAPTSTRAAGRPTPSDLQRRGRRASGPTSGWPSTATPTGCSPSTRPGRLGRRRPDHRDVRHRPPARAACSPRTPSWSP